MFESHGHSFALPHNNRFGAFRCHSDDPERRMSRRKKSVMIDNLAGTCRDDTPEQIQVGPLDTSIRLEPSPNQPSGSWVGQVRYLCIIKTEG